MNYIVENTLHKDLVNLPYDPAWHPVGGRYDWSQVCGLKVRIPAQATVITLERADELGLDIIPTVMKALRVNMADHTFPSAVYIYGHGMADFATAVGAAAAADPEWAGTQFWGYSGPFQPMIPAPGDSGWFRAFP